MIDSERSPRVSIVIVNWNKIELLEKTLLALQLQSFQDYETIVVDNGSTDGSVRLVAESFPSVRLLVLEENTGFAKGNNLGIQQARGELIVLLNNDAIPAPGWLEHLARAAEQFPEAGFFASRVLLYREPHLLDSAGDGITIAGTAYRRGHRESATRYASQEFVFGASGSAACYRRAVLQAIGLLDEDLFAVYEDVDLSFRAQFAGFRCLYVPQAMVYHWGSSTIGTYSDFYVYQTQRNVELCFVKNVPGALFVLLFPSHLIYNLAGWFFFTIMKRRGRAFLQAKLDALRALSSTLDKRRRIQARRRVSVSYIISLLQRDWLTRTLREKLG